MAQKKYQVFVSSTFQDLIEERKAVIYNILNLDHIPAGMESFPSAGIGQLDYIKKIIDECDYYILIIGGRYGSMDENGISYTEREYDYAVDRRKFVLAFVHSNPDAIPVGKSDIDSNVVEALHAFRNKVMTGRLVKQWSTQQELELSVLQSLIQAFTKFPQVGWIRGDSAASDDLLEQSNKILIENMELKEKNSLLTERKTINIDDIAELNDSFKIRYTTIRLNGFGSSFYDDQEITLTWLNIFLGIAGCLDRDHTDSAIYSGIKEAITEAKAITHPEIINERDKTRIKVQLIALGLIQTQNSGTTQEDITEYLTLTSKGRATFISGMVVRKKKPSKDQQDRPGQ